MSFSTISYEIFEKTYVISLQILAKNQFLEKYIGLRGIFAGFRGMRGFRGFRAIAKFQDE